MLACTETRWTAQRHAARLLGGEALPDALKLCFPSDGEPDQ